LRRVHAVEGFALQRLRDGLCAGTGVAWRRGKTIGECGVAYLIAGGEDVVLGDLAVEADSEVAAERGAGDGRDERRIASLRSGGVDDGVVLLIVVEAVHEEGGLLANGAADVSAQDQHVIRRLRADERILRV